MNYLQVDNGVIQNILVADNADIAERLGAVPSYDGARIGDPYNPPASEAEKAARIAQSKTDLATYLETHPLTWLDGNTYSVTMERQQLLTMTLFTAKLASEDNQNYQLTWNTTGDVCKEWTYPTLKALGFAINAYVKPLVTYQQTMEVAMREAQTQEELDAIVVDYDTVGAAAQEALS